MYEATCFTCVFISGNLTHKSSFRAVNAQKFDTFQLQFIDAPKLIQPSSIKNFSSFHFFFTKELNNSITKKFLYSEIILIYYLSQKKKNDQAPSLENPKFHGRGPAWQFAKYQKMPSDVAGYVGRVYCHEWG